MEESVNILRVDTGEAVQSVNDLRENIKLLKANLGELTIGSQAYQDTLEELTINQNALKNAMHATTASLTEVAAAAQSANVQWDENNKLINQGNISYNELVHTMAALKEEWRATTDVARRAELGEQIEQVNAQLKGMDASVGNFQRNVGNYSSALEGLEKGFLATAGGAGSVINPVKNVTAGFKALSATPVVGILGLLANIISKVIQNLKTSEENVNSVTQAMSVFAGAGDLVKNTMQVLGKAVSAVSNVLSNLALKIFPALRKAAELRNQITKEEIALSKEQREAVEKNADAELQIAKLKQRSVDKEKYTTKERIAFLEQAMALEMQVAQRAKDIAAKEYEIQLLKSKTAENSKEENDALAAAYANKVKAETEYYNKSKELTSQIVAAKKEERDEIAKSTQREIELNKSLWEMRLESAVKGSEDEYQIKAAILEDEYLLEKEKAKNEIKDADEKVRTLELIEKKYFEKRIQLSNEFADALHETERKQLENRMNAEKQNSAAFLKMKIELKEFELKTLLQKENESDEDFYARKLQAERDYLEAKKELTAYNIQMMGEVANATSGLLSSLADMYESDEKNSEKNAKKIKALRIASATIDMLNGAVGAFAQANSTLPPPAGQIVGAANAAAVIAMGIANINKIKSTNPSGGGASSTPAVVSPPSVDTGMQSVRSITSASEEERLNRMASNQRVYILQSDIEASGNQSKVQVEESSF